MYNRILAIVFALAVAAIPVSYTNVVEARIVTDGLVSLWTFDESSIEEKTAKDAWGDNHGTIIGEPKSVNGMIEEALDFDGVVDYVDCGNDISLSFGSNDFTVSLWFKIAAFIDSHASLIGKTRGGWAAPDVLGWEFALRSGGYYINIDNIANDAKGTIPLKSFSLGTFYYATFVVDRQNGEVRVYTDGEYLSKLNIGAVKGTLDNNYPLHIGWRIWGGFLNGLIDEVKIYSKALSEDEIQQNYDTTSQFGTAVEPANKLAATWGKIK